MIAQRVPEPHSHDAFPVFRGCFVSGPAAINRSIARFGVRCRPPLVKIMPKKHIPLRKKQAYHVGNLAPLLLTAARQVVAEEGASQLTVKAVADRADVTTTAAYYHYKDRAAILLSVAAEGFEQLARAVEANTRKGGTNPRSKAHIYVKFAMRNPHLYQLMFGPEIANASGDARLNAAKSRSFEALRSAVSIDLGPQAEPALVNSAALAAWSFAHGVVALLMDENIKLSRKTPFHQFYDQLADALQLFFESHKLDRRPIGKRTTRMNG
jgi:AcrR family transcriptional regulator